MVSGFCIEENKLVLLFKFADNEYFYKHINKHISLLQIRQIMEVWIC